MTLSRWFPEHRACFSIVVMAEPKATRSRGRPKKSTECEAAAVESDVEVVIENSSKALKTTNSCTSLGKVICCLTIRNRLLHEWYCSRSLPYVSQLNAQIAGHALMLNPNCHRVEENLARRAGALHRAITSSKGRAREAMLLKKLTIALTADDMQDCRSLSDAADEVKSRVVAIEEEMAERTAEVEDLRAKMATEIADYKLAARQYEEQLLKEGSMNTGKTFDEVNYY